MTYFHIEQFYSIFSYKVVEGSEEYFKNGGLKKCIIGEVNNPWTSSVLPNINVINKNGLITIHKRGDRWLRYKKSGFLSSNAVIKKGKRDTQIQDTYYHPITEEEKERFEKNTTADGYDTDTDEPYWFNLP